MICKRVYSFNFLTKKIESKLGM